MLQVIADDAPLEVPALLPLEVANALTVLVRRRKLAGNDRQTGLALLKSAEKVPFKAEKSPFESSACPAAHPQDGEGNIIKEDCASLQAHSYGRWPLNRLSSAYPLSSS